jgi:hypothetical protein
VTCTVASHEALKLDRERYLAETTPVGWQDMGDGQRCLIRNHTCGSSLLAEADMVVHDWEAYRAFQAEMAA